MSPWLQTLLPVAAGFAVVLIGILVFKLHAFLALILAAGVTAVLTPDYVPRLETLRQEGEVASFIGMERPRNAQDRQRFKVQYIFADPRITPDYEAGSVGYSLNPYWVVVNPATYFETGRIEAKMLVVGMPVRTIDGREQPIIVARLATVPTRAHATASSDAPLNKLYRPQPTDILIQAKSLNELGTAFPPIPQRITSAFGDTVGDIGILIAFAAVIGMCLLDSGAADRIVRSALGLVGQRGAPVGFAGCGFLLGIPVFFDTVFFLMIPLGKAMRLRTGRNYILYVLTIYCGATMAHSLVPPTPGPLMVAESLGIEIGVMMLVGCCVGLITASYGILHAWLVNRWIEIPLRDTPEMPLADLERLAAREDHELPPLWLSLLPILLPVWLIAQATALSLLEKNGMLLWGDVVAMAGWQKSIINALGEKNTALGIGVAVALFLLAWQTRASLRHIRDRVGMAIAAGGAIILITAAGGAFGDIIAQTGVASLIQDLPKLGTLGLLTLAFGVTVAIRTVQGSATVAMITAVGLFAGIETPFHPVWLALAIGCGSKPISWMTDSGFWVICKMSGMTEAETLKTLTPMTIMMGLVGLGTVLVGATLFPLR